MRLKACLAAMLAALLALAPLSAMASDDPLADLAQAKADLKAAKAALVGYEAPACSASTGTREPPTPSAS